MPRHRPPLYDVLQLSNQLAPRPDGRQPTRLVPEAELPPEFFAIQRASATENFFPVPTPPFRVNFALVSLTLHGSSERFIGLTNYRAQPGVVQLIPPYQIMGTLSRSPDYEALSFFFAPAFYRQQPLGEGLDALPFFALDATPYLLIPPADRIGLEEPVLAMEREYRTRADEWQAIVHAYLRIFFVRLKRLYGEQAVALSRATTTRQALAARFQRLVDQRFGQLIAGELVDPGSIRAYASTLGVEESYLGEVVREVTGRNPSELVRERLNLEACYLVRYSELTIGEIADLLGFSDVSYFSRWFKQHIGVPPAQYRR